MKLFRHVPLKGLVGGLAFVFALVAVQMTNVQFAAAATRTWTGAGADTKFSTTANWSGGVAPVTGDSLVFPTVGSAPTMINDLNSGGTTFVGVDVTGTTNYSVDSLTLSAGAVNVTSTGTLGVTAGLASSSTMTVNGNGLLTVGTVNVPGALTVSSNFTATTSTTAGSFVIGSSFNGGAITSSASLATGAHTITATTLHVLGNNLLTVSALGSIVASTSITVGSTAADTQAQLDAVSTSTINTPLITVYGSAGFASTMGGTFTSASNINLPNGSLILSTASTVGTVTVANLLTASNFTAATVTTDTLTISGIFTVTGTLTVASTTATLTINSNINVVTLAVTKNLTVTGSFTVTTVTVGDTLTVNTASFTATTVTAGTLVMTTAFNVTGTLTITNALAPLTVNQLITVGTLNVAGNLTITSAINPTTVIVAGTLTVSNASFSATTVTAGTLAMTTIFNVSGTLTVTNALTISLPITVGTLAAHGGLTISNGTGTFTASTAINVTGNLTASRDYSAPTVNVSGNATLTGYQSTSHIYVIGGTLTIGNDSTSGYVYVDNGTNVTGIVTVTNNTSLNQIPNATVDFGGLVVKNGGRVILYGTVTYPVTFGSGKSISSPAVGYNSYSYTLDVNNNPVYNTLKFTGAVTLLNDLQVFIYGNAATGSIEFAGTLNQNTFTIWKQNGTSGILVIGGVEVRNPAIVNEYNNSLPGTNVSVGDNETAIINGVRGYADVSRGGLIKGTGSVVDLYMAYGSTVSPGNSPGKLTVLNSLYFEAGSNYYAELQSTSAYDQLAVGAEYTSPSGYAVSLNDANLNVVLSDGFSMAQGDKFTIIDNKSSRPVSGTFNGLAEGAVFAVADGTFSISYIGGDGNDVVLTVVSAPTKPVQAPNTGFKILASNPLLILGLGVITAGFFLAMSSRRLSANR